MFVGLESMEGGLFFSVNQLYVFVEIGDFVLELLSLLLELFNFFVGVACLIFELYGVIFFVWDVFFEIVTGILEMQ